MAEQDETTALRQELHQILADLDALPDDAFTDRAPLRERADDLRRLIRSMTVDTQVVRDAEQLDELRRKAEAVRQEVGRIAGSGVHGGSRANASDAGGGDAYAMSRINDAGKTAQGMDRLQADLGTLEARIAAAERYLTQTD